MNQRGDIRPNLVKDDWTCPAPLLCSGRVMVSKETVRRVGIERCQSRIEAEPRPAVGTEDRVRLGHIDVDVRVVLRWGHAEGGERLEETDSRPASQRPRRNGGRVGSRVP